MRWYILARKRIALLSVAVLCCLFCPTDGVFGQGEWEITPESEAALERGLAWLARNQGPEGNWDSNDLGLVSTGILAFLAAGHLPDRGPYGSTVRRALDYVIRNAQPSGLLNIAEARRGTYNHGLS
nr:squalene--hopene cyclase [Thermogutta sp.]